MSTGFVDVYMVKQVMVHKIAVALVVVLGETSVLVKIDRGNLGEVQNALLKTCYQLLVGSFRSRSCGKSQHTVWL